MVDAYELSEDNEDNLLHDFILSYFGTFFFFFTLILSTV